ncbi:SMI1/KNR4 family protein [Pedobacter petrophilus]|uniref:SMI1/KNR4 family protein n=1 Tax=Pedobacter petrophilus TaxID=1908241 RepID=A0A7K0G3T1_9SPHI|nr:SMI1/KNR4 family protein [Pedobacter petrophilus]MRX78463.1 SMI1/KNR4 family protein [Pedobacter petrophilus]
MFEKKNSVLIFEEFDSRINKIKDLNKVPVSDPIYLKFLSEYKGLEITPDIEIFGYEDVLNENKYIEKNYPELYDKIWIIGRSGQGDEWFINIEKSTILFYDHNNGEYESIDEFLDFNIDFLVFLQAAFLFRELEEQLDDHEDNLPIEIQELFVSSLEKISDDFYLKYPYKYF